MLGLAFASPQLWLLNYLLAWGLVWEGCGQLLSYWMAWSRESEGYYWLVGTQSVQP
jgi:hypothetical protein